MKSYVYSGCSTITEPTAVNNGGRRCDRAR